jgi:pre-mRNA-processing factor 39
MAEQANGSEPAKADAPAPAKTEEETFWETVRANPADFNSWIELIKVTEKEDKIEKIEAVYDAFLEEYPLCYGYWKKYADKFKDVEQVTKIYERGVAAVAHSVDLWAHYCTYIAEKSEDLPKIRQYFAPTTM